MPNSLSIWIQACRPKTLPAAVMPVIIATALAWREGALLLESVVICFVFALLVQIGTNFANDYFDFKKGADTEKRIGPTRVVSAGLIAPEVMWRATLIILAVAFACGLLLLFYGGWWLLVIGVASVVCAVAYTGGPYPLGYNGWGDVFVILFFGIIAVVVTYYVQVGTFSMRAFIAGLSVGLVINNILVVNNYRDYYTDSEVGKNTLVVRFGRRFAWWQYFISYCSALCVLPVFLILEGLSVFVLLPMLLLPAAIKQTDKLKRSQSAEAFGELLASSAKMVIGYGLLLTVGIML